MFHTWVSRFPSIPLILTEINYRAAGDDAPDQVSGYLADLFTFTVNHRQNGTPTSYIHILWFQGTDDSVDSLSRPYTLGIYQSDGLQIGQGSYKPITLSSCPSHANLLSTNLNVVYFVLRNNICYSKPS